jgi:hypothetical protein
MPPAGPWAEQQLAGMRATGAIPIGGQTPHAGIVHFAALTFRTLSRLAPGLRMRAPPLSASMGLPAGTRAAASVSMRSSALRNAVLARLHPADAQVFAMGCRVRSAFLIRPALGGAGIRAVVARSGLSASRVRPSTWSRAAAGSMTHFW